MAKHDSITKPITQKIVKVPYCIQDTIPIYRISENGIFELENKKGVHQFDRMYLYEDINFTIEDEDQKELICKKFRMLLNSLNVSYKIIISNYYADNASLRETILRKASSKEVEPLAKLYHELLEKRVEDCRAGIQQSKYFILSCRKPDFESANNFFKTIEHSVQSFFRSMGSGLIPLSATERLRALHSSYRMGEEEKFSFDWEEYLQLKRDWRNDIINTSIREHKDYIEKEGKKVASTLFVRRFASGLNDMFLTEITNLAFPLVFTIDNEPINNNYAYKLVMKKYMSNGRSINKQQESLNKNGNFSANVSYEKRCLEEEAEDMLDGLRSFDERLFFVGITILVQGENRKELEERIEKVKLIGDTYNMEIVPYSYNQLDGMNTTLPTGARFVNNMRSLTTQCLSIFTPFNVQEMYHSAGICYGFNQVSKNLIIADRKKLNNGNGMVFGIPGSGKSFNEKVEMGQVLAFTEDDIIIIDPMGEYKDLGAKWHGQYINLSQSMDNKIFINPFHVPAFVPDQDKFIAEKAEFAFAICEQALKPSAITSKHIAIIDRAVRTMYGTYFNTKGKNKPSPTICTLREGFLAEEKENTAAKDLAEQLEVFSDGTLDIFAKEQSSSSNNRLTIYGFSELGKRLRAMAMLVMIETVTSKIKYNQEKGVATWVYLDEIHELWNDEYSLLAVERMWREVRKQGGLCTGMTQNLIDTVKNRATKTMVSNSEYTVLLNQGVMDKDALEDIFEISSRQLDYVNGVEKGTGLIRFGKKIIPFDNTVAKDTELYKLFNTDFHEKAEEKKHQK